ncbi:hypothetical protein [Collinsella intestinalis]|uniref:Uncharacterized protein n=1 Tax=Collinsella intestinalis TaxID=147207 RepID=A0A414NEA6_9ACTN|nr:hypothetical protein [Collinsella intestinalis]RHF38160.1 hypothetical protein DW682_00030 [Collinsella intestinalis]
MRVLFDCRTYEMGLCDWVSFLFKKMWFPCRRSLRFLKRSIAALADWWIIIPFAFLSYGVYLAFDPITELGTSGIVAELIGMVLGSFTLLFLKERVDFEGKRHATLDLQYRFYVDKSWELYDAFSTLSRAAGLEPHSFDDFYDMKRCRCFYPGGLVRIEEADRTSYHRALVKLDSEITALKETCYLQPFVDCSVDEINRLVFSVREKLLGLEDDGEVSWAVVCSLEAELINLMTIIGRPWHYANDEARKRLLRKYIVQHAEELL